MLRNLSKLIKSLTIRITKFHPWTYFFIDACCNRLQTVGPYQPCQRWSRSVICQTERLGTLLFDECLLFQRVVLVVFFTIQSQVWCVQTKQIEFYFITMTGLWVVIQVCSTSLCMVQCTHLISRCQQCRGRLVPRSPATPLVKGAHSNWLWNLSSMTALPETCQNSLKFHLQCTYSLTRTPW